MRLLIMGPPGAGKGTQATGVSAKLAVPHISTGDMFRQALKNETPTGIEAKKFMTRDSWCPTGWSSTW